MQVGGYGNILPCEREGSDVMWSDHRDKEGLHNRWVKMVMKDNDQRAAVPV